MGGFSAYGYSLIGSTSVVSDVLTTAVAVSRILDLGSRFLGQVLTLCLPEHLTHRSG